MVESMFKDYDRFDTPKLSGNMRSIDFKMRPPSNLSQKTSPTRVS